MNLTCQLTSPELQNRRATVIADLKHRLKHKEETENGIKLTFEGNDEILDKLLDFIKSERLCCDFFSFRLFVSRDDAHLEISGPEGSKEFLEHEVGF